MYRLRREAVQQRRGKPRLEKAGTSSPHSKMRLDAETMAVLGQCPRRPERLGRKAPLQILGRIEPSAMRAWNLA